MARRPVSKELWQKLQPLIPPFIPSNKGGPRTRAVSDKAAFEGIIFVLRSGIPWEDLPQSMGYGSGFNLNCHCRNRLTRTTSSLNSRVYFVRICLSLISELLIGILNKAKNSPFRGQPQSTTGQKFVVFYADIASQDREKKYSQRKLRDTKLIEQIIPVQFEPFSSIVQPITQMCVGAHEFVFED